VSEAGGNTAVTDSDGYGVGSDIASLARALVLDPTEQAIGQASALVRSNGSAALSQIGRAAVLEGTFLPLMDRLSGNGVDISRGTITRETAHRARLDKLIPSLRQRSRIGLAELYESVQAHQRLLAETLIDLAGAVPCSFVVGWGLARQLSFPFAGRRQSSDIDLIVPSRREAALLRAHMIERLRFSLRFRVRGASELEWWCYAGLPEGHMIKVDMFIGGLPSARHSWLPPFRHPDLFAEARQVPLERGALLVPSTEDLMLMTADKALRTGFSFTDRRISDIDVMLDDTAIDWSRVVHLAQRHGVSVALHWLIAQSFDFDARVPGSALAALAGRSWERRIVATIARDTSHSRRARHAVRIAHRWLWVMGYIRTTQGWRAPVSEVLAGRFARPISGSGGTVETPTPRNR
jgi:hypothetical protein